MNDNNIKNNILTYEIYNEIDHHSAKKIREEIDNKIYSTKPKTLILDMTNTNFMDSSGLGLILGRLRLMNEINGELKILNPSNRIYKIIQMAGIEKLVKIERNKTNEK